MNRRKDNTPEVNCDNPLQIEINQGDGSIHDTKVAHLL